MATGSPSLPLYVKRRKLLVISNPRRYASRKQQGVMATTPPLMPVMKNAVPLVVTLLVLQYQIPPQSKKSPSPAAFMCFVAATCVYWLTVGATKQYNYNHTGMGTGTGTGRLMKLHRAAALALGILSALSLLSMFLPHPVSLLPLLMWVPLALLLTWPSPFRWIITKILQSMAAATARGGGGGVDSNNQLHVLPV